MYDKVRLWIDVDMVEVEASTIANYLDKVNTQVDHQTGEVKTFGSLDGLKISIFVGGISVVGSLAKYLYGSNVYALDRHTTADAVGKLSDALHLQTDKAKVTGLEFGTSFLMKHPVTAYLAKLGDMPRLSRMQIDEPTLYYKGTGKEQQKVFAFYDKIAEAQTKGLDYPKEWADANLLRYEMRLNKRLPYQLGVQEVTASTLYQQDFYRMLMRRYQDSYFSITKINQIKTDVMSEIKTVSDAYDVFVARLISQTDQTQIRGYLNELKEAGVFNDRNYYTRLKKKIQDVATKANFTISDELMKELDDEIKNCGAYV